jgi:GYF domain 2
MASWFYASEGKQQGPYPEGQFRDLIAQGVVRADTLVWSEGMAGWQKAADIPGLIGGAGVPPMVPTGGPPMTGGYTGAGGGGSLSVDFGILDFTWRTLVMLIVSCFVIPVPWIFVWYTKWIVSCVKVPGRPNLSFTGNAMALVPWFFGFIVLAIVVGYTGIQALSTALYIVQIVLYWMLLKWMVANLASNEQPLGLSFTGSVWGYIGWNLLFAISIITIIGWAWVAAAQLRWMARNVQGTRREIVFKGTGLGILWRGIVAAILCSLIIPIPWVYRWIMNWFASQTELAPRGSM